MSFTPSAPDFSVIYGGGHSCKHVTLRSRDDNDRNIYPYGCTECSAKFAECAVDNVEGELSLHDFTVKRGKRSARRRGF